MTGAPPPMQHPALAPFARRWESRSRLLEILDPEVVFRVDAGARAGITPTLLAGATDVAQHAAVQGPRFATLCEPALVNGAAGVTARTQSGVLAVVGITIVSERITEIDLILDPDKLARRTISP